MQSWSSQTAVATPRTKPGTLSSSPTLSDCKAFLLKTTYTDMEKSVQKAGLFFFIYFIFPPPPEMESYSVTQPVEWKKKTEQEKLVNQVFKHIRTYIHIISTLTHTHAQTYMAYIPFSNISHPSPCTHFSMSQPGPRKRFLLPVSALLWTMSKSVSALGNWVIW